MRRINDAISWEYFSIVSPIEAPADKLWAILPIHFLLQKLLPQQQR